ncbi:hypothetical protein ABBQ38_006137 [Trebouxia sp. C0009 RCD-2024]
MRLKHSTQACLSNHVWRVSSSPGCGLCCSIGDLQKRKALSQPRFARTSCKCTAASALVQDGWPLWAALSACAAGGQVLEQRTSFGAALSAPLLSLLLALLLSAAGILPTANPVYDMIWTYIMPLGAALYLLESDLRQLLNAASSTFGAFIIGAAGSVAGTVVAWQILGPRLGPDGWKVASALCASYIGGSVNFAAVSQSLGLAPGPLLAASMAADNIAMAVYLTAIMVIPAENVVATATPQNHDCTALDRPDLDSKAMQPPGHACVETTTPSTTEDTTITSGASTRAAVPAAPSVESISLALAFGIAACGLGQFLAGAVGLPSINLAAMAVVASLFASVGSSVTARTDATAATPFKGAETLGGAAMLLFFATIGAGVGSLTALRSTGWLTAFIAIQLGVHMAVIILGGFGLARLPMQVVLTASNANIGGPATAAAMAAARGWPHMVRPAMLTGSFGYAVGTAIGCAVSQWLRVL